jgi:hypothetical protein
MLSFLKKIFGSKPAETPAPYKVEAPKVEVESFPVKEATPAVKAKPKRAPAKPKAVAKPAPTKSKKQ